MRAWTTTKTPSSPPFSTTKPSASSSACWRRGSKSTRRKSEGSLRPFGQIGSPRYRKGEGTLAGCRKREPVSGAQAACLQFCLLLTPGLTFCLFFSTYVSHTCLSPLPLLPFPFLPLECPLDHHAAVAGRGRFGRPPRQASAGSRLLLLVARLLALFLLFFFPFTQQQQQKSPYFVFARATTWAGRRRKGGSLCQPSRLLPAPLILRLCLLHAQTIRGRRGRGRQDSSSNGRVRGPTYANGETTCKSE